MIRKPPQGADGILGAGREGEKWMGHAGNFYSKHTSVQQVHGSHRFRGENTTMSVSTYVVLRLKKKVSPSILQFSSDRFRRVGNSAKQSSNFNLYVMINATPAACFLLKPPTLPNNPPPHSLSLSLNGVETTEWNAAFGSRSQSFAPTILQQVEQRWCVTAKSCGANRVFFFMLLSNGVGRLSQDRS